MGQLYLQGWSVTELAARFGVDRKTIDHHLEHAIRPEWQAVCRGDIHEEYARVQMLYRFAWEQMKRSLDPQTKEQLTHAFAEAEGSGVDPKLVEKVITKIEREGSTNWAGVIRWCIEWHSKVQGLFRPQNINLDVTNFRVAGIAREDLDQAMLAKVAEMVKQSKAALPKPRP